ncbi:MAG: hypothetical protein N4A57_02835 [Anaeromicrobium sp.]|jgi:hypothetical protein|uniref:hypothetical protein n=1 Tax=Anaeromicrobium sp. TaxID=1929132 RepID=UPI0025E3B30F|nr:hypothetical protein [Anaeromicrobium sp.]MCT4593197.1 hypothetical protein [Anaeromicrobium sp.]
MTKQEMIDQLIEWNQDPDELKEMTYKELKSFYKEMKEEFSDDYLLFPNGRDRDAEDEDGI